MQFWRLWLLRNSNRTDHKFVIIVNKTIPIGNAMNAIGHITLSLICQGDELSTRSKFKKALQSFQVNWSLSVQFAC